MWGQSGRESHSSTRRLIVWFVATTLLPAAALTWLGWILVRQDRTLDADRRRTGREQFAELAATALQRTLAQLEERLASFDLTQPGQSPPIDDGVAVVLLARDALLARHGLPLPFYPAAPPASSGGPDVLVRADALEFVQGDLAGALHLLEPQTSAADPALRAESFLRVGRLRRKLGDASGARDAFSRLRELDDTRAGGLPAGLAGAQAEGFLLAAQSRESLSPLAERLRADLLAGRWPLTREQFELGLRQANEWLGGGQAQAEPDLERAALAAAVEMAWTEWRRADEPSGIDRGRRARRSGDRSVLVLQRASDDRMLVMVAGSAFLDRQWRQTVAASGGSEGVELALTDADGLPVLGSTQAPPDAQSVRTASTTNLPWTVHAVSPPQGPASLSRPVATMLTGIGIMLLVVVTGGYFIGRAMARELRVARLQSDFVAAVSHEFRTPLTTMRQLSEMLALGRVTEGKRAAFYQTLLRESDRLQRLVESLLDFARLEAGQLECRLQPLAPASFIRDLVRDFGGDVAGRDVRVESPGVGDDVSIQADPVLLGRVFWNLLDNAVKYSPPDADIAVRMETAGGRLIVHVRDRGIGIPEEEQKDIFRKFARGAASKERSIRGTGIGLAMAREIVRAHGGDITFDSRIGQGSTFTVAVPMGEAAVPEVGPETVAPGSRAS